MAEKSTVEIILAIFATIVGSSSLFAFIQFLVTRKDKKDDQMKDLQKIIEGLRTDIHNNDVAFKKSLDDLAFQVAKSTVIQCRIRILRANDELRQGSYHSYEYFRQLHQDITDYEQYCAEHPEFKNNEAVNSIEYINRVYQECLDKNNFLA